MRLKKLFKLIVLITVVFISISCSQKPTTNKYLNVDYSDFIGQFIEETDEQLSMPQDDYYIYYYGTYCSACIEIKSQLLDTLYRAKNTTIYFVLVNSYKDIHDDSGVTGTPTIIHVINNEVTESYSGGTSILEMIDQIT